MRSLALYPRWGPGLGGPNLVYGDVFNEIGSIASADADALGSVHCQPTGCTLGRTVRATSWLATPRPSVVEHSHVKTEQSVSFSCTYAAVSKLFAQEKVPRSCARTDEPSVTGGVRPMCATHQISRRAVGVLTERVVEL